MIRIGNKCISSSTCFLIIAGLLFGTMLLANIYTESDSKTINDIPHNDSTSNWIPTKEDIKYQDSMWVIINQTQLEVDTIKESIDQILIKLDRIEYEDGTYDSIRYVIEPNKDNQSR